MGFPAIAMSAAVGMQAIGSIMGGEAASASAKYQAAVARNNAVIAQQNAAYALQAGERAATKKQLETAGTIGREKAIQGAGNLDVNTGSPADVRGSTASLGELDALTIRNNAARQAYGYATQSQSFGSQAALDTAAGSQALTAGYIGAGTSLLSGASSVAQKWGDIFGSGSSGFTNSNSTDWSMYGGTGPDGGPGMGSLPAGVG